MGTESDVGVRRPRRDEVFDGAELRALSGRSWRHGVGRLTVHALLYAAAVTAPMLVDSWWLRIPCWVAAGFVLAGLHSVLHYCSHGTFVRGAAANRVLGRVAGAVVLMNGDLYRAFHMRHHRLTGRAGDPEPDGAFTSVRQYLLALPNVDYLVAFGRLSVAALAGRFPDFVRGRRERAAARCGAAVLLGWLLVVIALTVLWPATMLAVYLVPVLLAGMINFLSALPEHYHAESTPDPWSNTSSVYTRSRAFRFLYWNSNYHAEHHLFPGVPAWRLPSVAARVRPHLAHAEASYLRFHGRLLADLARGRATAAPVGEGRRADFWYPVGRPDSTGAER